MRVRMVRGVRRVLPLLATGAGSVLEVTAFAIIATAAEFSRSIVSMTFHPAEPRGEREYHRPELRGEACRLWLKLNLGLKLEMTAAPQNTCLRKPCRGFKNVPIHQFIIT